MVPLVGIGCTAALATDRPKRGAHRVHVARCTAESVVTYSIEFTKGLRDREGEDSLASQLVIRALAEAADVASNVSLSLAPSERIAIAIGGSGDHIDLLLTGALDTVLVRADGTITANGRPEGTVLSGSFDPLHIGHRELASVASETLSVPVTLEMSVANVDKPPLSGPVIRERLKQFAGKYDIVLTKAPYVRGESASVAGLLLRNRVRYHEAAHRPGLLRRDDERKNDKALWIDIHRPIGRPIPRRRTSGQRYIPHPRRRTGAPASSVICLSLFPSTVFVETSRRPTCDRAEQDHAFQRPPRIHRLPRRKGRSPSHHGARQP